MTGILEPSEAPGGGILSRVTAAHPWWPYVVPLGIFLALTSAEGMIPTTAAGESDPFWYPVAYAVKIALVALSAWLARSCWRDLRPVPGGATIGAAVGLGVLVAIVWVGLDHLPYPRFGDVGERIAFDPATITSQAGRWGFLAVRFLGLVLIVPLIEELFWRSFLIRWIINPDFERIPVGQVTWAAALVTSGLFALAHPAEWPAAFLTGMAWAGLLSRTKSLSACFLSHLVANLALGIYIVATGSWRFW
jgi:CAAX prenyl protease-like protein